MSLSVDIWGLIFAHLGVKEAYRARAVCKLLYNLFPLWIKGRDVDIDISNYVIRHFRLAKSLIINDPGSIGALNGGHSIQSITLNSHAIFVDELISLEGIPELKFNYVIFIGDMHKTISKLRAKGLRKITIIAHDKVDIGPYIQLEEIDIRPVDYPIGRYLADMTHIRAIRFHFMHDVCFRRIDHAINDITNLVEFGALEAFSSNRENMNVAIGALIAKKMANRKPISPLNTIPPSILANVLKHIDFRASFRARRTCRLFKRAFGYMTAKMIVKDDELDYNALNALHNTYILDLSNCDKIKMGLWSLIGHNINTIITPKGLFIDFSEFHVLSRTQFAIINWPIYLNENSLGLLTGKVEIRNYVPLFLHRLFNVTHLKINLAIPLCQTDELMNMESLEIERLERDPQYSYGLFRKRMAYLAANGALRYFHYSEDLKFSEEIMAIISMRINY
jgi:hypothetical protein